MMGPMPFRSRILFLLPALLGGLLGGLLSACGPSVDLSGPEPEPVATSFARAWTAGKCAAAVEQVLRPEKGWAASCRDAFRLAKECEELPGSGNPQGEDCGPRTRITVSDVEVKGTSYTDDADVNTATVTVLVSWTKGASTHRQKTRHVVLQEVDGEWRVTGYT